MHATPTARDFFRANFYPPCPFTCISSKTSREFFPVLAVANIAQLTPLPVWARRMTYVTVMNEILAFISLLL